MPSRIISQNYILLYPASDQKCPFLWYFFVAPTRCGLSPLPPNLFAKPWGWSRISPNSQKFTISPTRNSNFHVITLYKLYLHLQSFLLYFFNDFSHYVHRCQLQHGKSIEWPKFAFLPPYAIWITLLLEMLVFIFFPLPFLFQVLKNLTWPHFSCDFVVFGLIKYNGFQISRIKWDETSYLILKHKLETTNYMITTSL